MSSLADETRWMDAVDQAALVAKGDVTPSELLEAAIERMEAVDPAVHALTITWFDHAREIAASADCPTGRSAACRSCSRTSTRCSPGRRCPTATWPSRDAAIVDTTDTTLVARYRAAGLVVAGRTNSPEMGSLPTTQPIGVGPDAQPVGPGAHAGRLERRRGGGRGGGMVPFANASDGGGSIRIPASACGLVGLKPSQGRTSIGPVRAEASLSVEHCVSRTVRDSAALLDAVRGPGVGDTVIAPPPTRPVRRRGRRRPGPAAHRAAGRPPDGRGGARRLRRRRARRGDDARGPRPRRVGRRGRRRSPTRA